MKIMRRRGNNLFKMLPLNQE